MRTPIFVGTVGRVLRVLALGLILIPVGQALAANGLPATAAAYPGSYKTNDPGGASGCSNVNFLTGTCTCAGNLPPAISIRSIGDGNGVWGGWAYFCPTGSPTTQSEFGGAYQIDDTAICRVANANTGACSCPGGTVPVTVRALADNAAGLIGSWVVICQKQTASPVSFGGAFQVDDPGGYGCRAANPNTGACSCTAGFNAQAHRVLVDGPRGSHFYTCVPPLPTVQICPGQTASPSGNIDATTAIQTCLNNYSSVELPAGTYLLSSPLSVPSGKILRTQGTSGSGARCFEGTQCAALTASANFSAPSGIVQSVNTSGVVLDHVIIDGNRSLRMQSASANSCRAGNNVYGFNANFGNCTSCQFTSSVSMNALCGTGFQWLGDNAVIHNSIFASNGDSTVFADGLTLLQSNNAQVTNNSFLENTDINFIFGGGTNATVYTNLVQNVLPSRFAFAGMMMDNFNGATSGNFTGATFGDNTINCQRCSFAFNVGPHPWYAGTVYGGTLWGNRIAGGHISLNVDGAGFSPSTGVAVIDNLIGPYVNHNISCMPPTFFNLAPGSWLYPTSNNVPTASFSTAGCHK